MLQPKSQYPIPRVSVEGLWACFNPAGFRKGFFLILRGYIDESYNPRMFTLSAILASGLDWAYFISSWKKNIDAKNKELRKEGRRPISRFHASDFSNRRGEFEGWTPDEQTSFMQGLVRVFHIPKWMWIVAYSVPLDLLANEFPEYKNKVVQWSYALMLNFLMHEMAETLRKAKKKGPIRKVSVTLFHDRSSFDGLLADTFNRVLCDPDFQARDYFISIAALGWEDCVPLQAADLLAYEHQKDADRRASNSNREQRKNLRALLHIHSLGGGTMRFDADSIYLLKRGLNAQAQGLRSYESLLGLPDKPSD